ncbi:hypothetical protein CI109_106254 [Kwoniella shandongensis]|uniref:Uncharacterized protein n=1 Tax=Kwoniella shandongensis TaxID=1734106 RepID=A0A5M6C2U4_9TREE|nr:uncharacterized protein CI109_003857 [Kwoniella shandongensis]KAA5527885.1 hypothetical protein CI109_003857 [Kwoniella shandongensis]
MPKALSTTNRKGKKEVSEQTVGMLHMVEKGKKKRRIPITLDTVCWIGRHRKCDVVINHPEISSYHLRLFAVKTSTNQSLAVIHDLSSNGYRINNELFGEKKKPHVRGITISTKSMVLKDGDVLTLPGSGAVFTYHHEDRHRYQIEEMQYLLPQLQLFRNNNPQATYSIFPWIVENYPLGTGANGVVHLGRNVRGHGQMAIKTTYAQKGFNEDAVRREVQLMSRVVHPNVAGLLDMVREEKEADGSCVYHLVMECLTGGDLFSYLAKHTRLEEKEVRWIAWQCVNGLRCLHDQGIAHRDIKPENIMLHTLAAYPRILISDIGLATTLTDHIQSVPDVAGKQTVSRPNDRFAGTERYIPPEIYEEKIAFMSKGKVNLAFETREEIGTQWFEEDTAMDAWALGVTVYHCASGYYPFDGNPYAHAPSSIISDLSDLSIENDEGGDPDQSTNSDSQNTSLTPNSGNRTESASDESENPTMVIKQNPRYQGCLRMLKKIRQFKAESEWFPKAVWADWTPAGKEFIESLLEYNPETRLDMTTAAKDKWFTDGKKHLEKLNEAVLVKGGFIRWL